jgi:lipoprotein-releasing system permease protein
VALGTASLVIVLSAFNGLEDVLRKQYSIFNPDLKVFPQTGKTFIIQKSTLKAIQQTQGVEIVTEVLEDDAVLKYKDRQMVARIKGVSENFMSQSLLPQHIRAGEFALEQNGYSRAVLGLGVFFTLSMQIGDVFPLEVWYPNRKQKITLSEKDIRRVNIFTSGTFEVEYEYDQKYVIVPLAFTQELMDYEQERSHLEIKVKEGYDDYEVKEKLLKISGGNWLIKTQEEQQENILRAIKTEKLFAYITLSVILLIASLNIFFSLTMLAIEKRKDVAVLSSMGANKWFVQNIFLKEGFIIASMGAFAGLALGGLLCWMQQTFELVGMGIESSIIRAYPIRMQAMDFFYTGLIVFFITFLISYFPAKKASKTDLKAFL